MTIDEQVKVDAQLFCRDLPGGGYVAIEQVKHIDGDREVPRTRVCVERRTASDRRSGHQPPVIAEVEGAASMASFAELYCLAVDNVAIARALLDWQRRGRAD